MDYYAIKCLTYRVIHPHKYRIIDENNVELETYCFQTPEDALECCQTGDISKALPGMDRKITVPKQHNDDFTTEDYIQVASAKISGEIHQL
jgi:hypothetical protein